MSSSSPDAHAASEPWVPRRSLPPEHQGRTRPIEDAPTDARNDGFLPRSPSVESVLDTDAAEPATPTFGSAPTPPSDDDMPDLEDDPTYHADHEARRDDLVARGRWHAVPSTPLDTACNLEDLLNIPPLNLQQCLDRDFPARVHPNGNAAPLFAADDAVRSLQRPRATPIPFVDFARAACQELLRQASPALCDDLASMHPADGLGNTWPDIAKRNLGVAPHIVDGCFCVAHCVVVFVVLSVL